MNESISLSKTYLFIRKNRFHRKKVLYKKALSVLIDKTIAIYLFVLLGYLIASFFIMGDFVNDYFHYFNLVEQYAEQYLLFILTLIPMQRVLQSFSSPGIIYSTSEHQLSFLPYSRKGLWLLSVIEKWLKSLIGYFSIGLLIVLITPITFSLVVKSILLIVFMNILMTIPVWVLFQKHIIIKLAWLGAILVTNALYFAIPSPWLGLLIVALLILSNFILWSRVFNHVNFSKVTEVSDFKIWNMTLISRASGVKIKRQKKYSFFQNLKFRKKPFTYTEKAIHHRMWSLYLAKNIGLIMQFIGALIALLIVLMFTKPLLYQLALVFSLHAYTSIVASFYSGRFDTDILPVLPWNLFRYKSTFLKWANYGALIIFIPILIALIMNPTVWLPVQLLFYLSVYCYLYHVKLNKAIIFLARKSVMTDMKETMGYLCLLVVILSAYYPFLSLGVLGVIWLISRERRYTFSEASDSPF